MRLLDQLKNITWKIIQVYKNGTQAEKKRILIIGLSLFFFMDYIMFCYLTEKNIFDIFPSIPSLTKSHEVTLFLPTFNDMSLEKETRNIPLFVDKEREVMHLFYEVIRGSKFENTSLFVPLDIFIRKIWFVENEKTVPQTGERKVDCIIDVEPGLIDEKITVIPGSEDLFVKALEKTIKENYPSVTSVSILDRGIPGRRMWDVAAVESR
ncbi:MAG TPA: hypothetical protein PK926_01385 [Spirochaetota bacterium]|nr:hypothetical protein [Spirochaetota bacterium]HPI88090.1 hypothetical protein [Spirochaetota bacterium]HPR46425.1 hypothetical protein [Spirochaetota bacterium]